MIESHQNLILDQAAALIADISRSALPPLNVVVIGSDGTTPVGSDTGIITEIGRGLVPSPGTNLAHQVNVRSGSTVTIKVPFTGFTGTVREVSIYSVTSPPGISGSGTALNRALVGPYNFTNGQFAVAFDLLYG
jgi:hypothetical protein